MKELSVTTYDAFEPLGAPIFLLCGSAYEDIF
jgi:hypothetical protein